MKHPWKHSCKPRADARRIFCSVIAAIEAAGIELGKDSGPHVIMLAFAIDKLRRTRGATDVGIAERLRQAARDAGTELGLPPEVVRGFLEDREE